MNKLIVVTGGTKGIGRGIVEAFVQHGFDVVTCARTEDQLASLKTAVGEMAPNAKVHTFKADLSKRADVDAFLKFVKKTGRPVDVLVNNTGVFIPGQVHTEEEGALETMIDTNLYSAYHLSRGIIPGMKEVGKGHIFNICSIASIVAYANGGSYAISKFAMYGMSKVLREEMKPFGIRVSSVLPGATFTASWEKADIPEERFIPLEDVATMVWAAYSLSPRSVVEDIVIRPQLGDI